MKKSVPTNLRYTQLLRFITPHRPVLLTLTALLLAGTAISLLYPLLAGMLTKSLLAESDSLSPPVTYGVPFLLFAWLGLMVLKAFSSAASSYLVGTTGARMSAELRARVFDHLQILPLSYHQNRKQGDTLALLSNDAELLSQFVTNTLVQLLPLVLTFVAAFVIMAWLDPLIAVLAALLMPAYYIVMKLLGRKMRPLASAWIKSWSGLIAFVNENLGLLPVIKSFGREPIEADHFAEHNAQLLGLSRRQVALASVLGPLVGLLAGAGSILLLWIAIGHMQSGQLQPAQLVSLLFYVVLLMQPLAGLANVYGQVMRSRGAADRLLAFFTECAEPDNAASKPLPTVKGRIEFRQVCFSYPGRATVLDHFDLSIERGETIALTGPNGAGKSTLIQLLMRFIQPDSGQILIDGVDISAVSLASLRQQIGVVAQHTLLLNGTIAQNIAYAQPLADRADLRQAARAARADEFISALPEGYQTVIGDHGLKLSGGQRQRLSLARTLLKNPPILVLDEAMSMFDPDAENSFIASCDELLQTRTVILITHRPASLALADRIVKMQLHAQPAPETSA